MNGEKVSLTSTFINLFLAVFKIIAALISGSASVLAEGIHSTLDIISSLITYLGVRVAKKPSNQTYQYGFYRVEVLSGAIVSLLLAITGFWIIYEGISQYSLEKPSEYSYFAIGIMAASILVNEIMARLKFAAAGRENSISLTADGEHSRADVIASLGVLMALLITPYFSHADSIVAILVGLYILYEAYFLGRQATFSLLDVADQEAEEEIREISKEQKINIKELKTRKMGSVSFAEIKIEFESNLSIDKADAISRQFEIILKHRIDHLKQIVISIESMERSTSTIFSHFGTLRAKRGFQIIGPDKRGTRIAIPVDGSGLAEGLGSRQYLIADEDERGNILQTQTEKNPFFGDGKGGVKFLRSVQADKVLSRRIGENAKNNLKSNNIESEVIEEIPKKYHI